MVGVLILANTMYTYFLLLFTIATANGNQPGTVDGESINFSKNHAYVCCTVVTIVTANRNRLGTVDGESINLIHSNSEWEPARHSRW